MFSGCKLLKELNLNNFNINNVTNMEHMFSRCSSLKELCFNNFNSNELANIKYMFNGCSNELKRMIKIKYRNIKEEAF